jgi:hypothetical protein
MSIGLDFVPNVQVSPFYAPAAAAAGGGIYLVWKDTGNGFIWTNKFSNGSWSSSNEFQARPGTSSAPAITSIPPAFQGEAMLFWQGAPEAPTAIFLASVDDSTFGQQEQLKALNGTPATQYPPAAASFNDALYVAWIELNSPNGNQIYIASCKLDGGWQSMQAVPLPDGIPTTAGEGTIALAADDNNLVLAWVTKEGVKWASTSDGVKWTASAIVDTADTTLCAPVILPYQGRTCLIAYSVKNAEIVLKSYDGKSWTGESAIPFTHTRTVSYPAAATYQNILHIFWALSNGDVAWVQFNGFTPDAAPSPLPASITWTGGNGFGSGPTNANYTSTLVLSQDGTVQYSGTWNDTGSIPIVDAPSQSYTVEYAVMASNNKVFTFSQSGTVPTASSGPWNVASKNEQIQQNWEALSIGNYVKIFASDQSDASSLFETFVEDFATIVGTVVEILD